MATRTRDDARDRASRRLRAAIAEQDRLTYRHEAAAGTPGEAAAAAARRGADDQVAARDAWARWADEGRRN